MVTTRRERKATKIKLAQPDRSGPSEKTLLQFAEERDLFDQADQRQAQAGVWSPDSGDDADDEEEEPPLSPGAERVLETVLWSVSLSMLHFTLDVLVQHQYAMTLSWEAGVTRFFGALFVFTILIYIFHPHYSAPDLVPRVPRRYQHAIRQACFLATSIYCGIYLIHITNNYGYYKILKQSPPLGCLWIWSVIELDLSLASLSLACAGGYYWYHGYTFALKV